MDSAMGITSALNTGSLGIQRGLAAIGRKNDIYVPGRQDLNIVGPITDLIQGRNQVKASASFVRS